MNVLVTGGTGYIGRFVIARLLEKENINITAICRDKKRIDDSLIHPNINWLIQDLELFDAEVYKKIGKPSNIVHLAWDGLPNYEAEFHIKNNLLVQKKFLKILVDSGAKNILITGTCLEYGGREGCLVETMIPRPSNAYAISKNKLRLYLESLQKKEDFLLKWLRVFYVYGPRQQAHTLIGQLDRVIESNGNQFNMSNGMQMRDYLHVREVASYIVSCLTQNKVHGIINCCSGNPISIRDLVFKYLEERKYDLRLNYGAYYRPAHEANSFWGSNTKLMEAIGINE